MVNLFVMIPDSTLQDRGARVHRCGNWGARLPRQLLHPEVEKPDPSGEEEGEDGDEHPCLPREARQEEKK